ncbi:efflux RND transporter permease subunit [Alkanindiges illinoisensis]|uniref:efflux RND transporter permease subunit n=1 Tax=Alkanindiges illinoisensis TaxID=197183 RepID=UPI00047BA2BD|nr:efflux RND transporter permease subunit [Alkanindiges illinoisensis]
MSRFFIDRPIFAWVIAIVAMLAGIISVLNMPIAQYPTIAPPTITVNAIYPGASAKTAEDSVTQIIEQQMNGLDGLQYISSQSSGDGRSTVTLSFIQGTNPDIAQVQVQNKLQAATPLLPEEVQRQGIRVTKSGASFLQVLAFVSEDGSLSGGDIKDYVTSTIADPLSRVEGVGEIQVFGGSYAMRIWLDPAKLMSYQLTPADISTAIRAQNTQVSVGQLGGAPSVAGQQLNATINAQSRLQTPEEFRNIFLKTMPNGAQVRLQDVARVELGSDNYQFDSRFNGKPAGGVAIRLATGANALDTAEAVEARMQELRKNYPAGLKDVVAFDTTPFIKISIEDVVKTLLEAIVLVFLVMFLFLQNWRATIIPTLAVPVVILGTFAIINLLGFSINTLTMFGMVLAIGLLVDDAIVVVENVERVMQDEKLSPVEATRKSMGQISGALVGITTVLSAVFIPMAFFGGSTGVIYRQFSVTLVTSMVLSVLVALIFTPALCATILRKSDVDHHNKKGFFGWFNRNFEKASHGYQGFVDKLLHHTIPVGIVYAAIIAILAVLFIRMPTAFLPNEDQGVIFTLIQLPPNATLDRTNKAIEQVNYYYLNHEKDVVESVFSVAGFSFTGIGQNAGIAFVKLKDWDERTSADFKVPALVQRSMGALSQIKDTAYVLPVAPPAVIELGTANGFNLQLKDVSGMGHAKLVEARNMLLGMAGQASDTVVRVRPNGQEDTPQYQINIDQAQAGAMGVSIADINSLMSTAWGGTYVNDFIDRGRVKKVYVQGDTEARMTPEDMNKWYVRNSQGAMIPFSAFATGQWSYGSPRLERYNGVSSVNIQGEAAPGVSSGDAMRAMEQMIAKLPPGLDYEWTGLSLEEQSSGAQAPMLYTLSLLIVFLCLAALYESWSVPFSVLLVVPLGILGAVLFTTLRHLSNDIYFQVAILAVIGLSAKNAILIVEFAKEQQEAGRELRVAILEAVRLRLRPIVMTSLAFGFGVIPLAISNGAGAGSQNAVGTGVLGGVISATFLGIFFIPIFYFWVRRLFKGKTVIAEDHRITDQTQEP